MRASLLLILLFLLLGCKEPVTHAQNTEKPPSWSDLVARDGCLVGQQDSIHGLGEGTCLRETRWQTFICSATPDTIKFLCSRLSSTQKTSVHTCPYGSAIEGELSLYVLQHITKKLWRDYDGEDNALISFIASNGLPEDESGSISEQNMIKSMLNKPSFISSLQSYFSQ